MAGIRRLVMSSIVLIAVLLGSAAPVLASNVCPVVGGPSDASIKTTPAVVPDKSANPAHGVDPSNPQPGDAFWN
jgi:hypothetical protein